MALLTGLVFKEYIENKEHEKIIKISAGIFAFIGFVVVLSTVIAFYCFLSPDKKLVFLPVYYSLILLFSTAPAFLLLFLWKNKRAAAFGVNIIFMFGVIFAAVNFIIPIVLHSGENELISYARYYNRVDFKGKKLITYEVDKPSVIFYAVNKVYRTNGDLISGDFKKNKLNFVIITNEKAKKLPEDLKYKLVLKGKKYSLIAGNVPYKLKEDIDK